MYDNMDIEVNIFGIVHRQLNKKGKVSLKKKTILKPKNNSFKQNLYHPSFSNLRLDWNFEIVSFFFSFFSFLFKQIDRKTRSSHAQRDGAWNVNTRKLVAVSFRCEQERGRSVKFDRESRFKLFILKSRCAPKVLRR